MKVFQKTYDGESLYDLERDIGEAFDAEYNEAIAKVPVDQYGLHQGRFIVTVEWKEEE